MARNKLGTHTFRPETPVYIGNWAAVGGKKEAEGPLGYGGQRTPTAQWTVTEYYMEAKHSCTHAAGVFFVHFNHFHPGSLCKNWGGDE